VDVRAPRANGSEWLLSHPPSGRPQGGLRHPLSDRPATTGTDGGKDRSPQTSGSRGCQLPQAAHPPAPVLDGLITLSRPRSPQHGGHPIKIVVADDTTLVEHRVNAERPQAVTRQSSQPRTVHPRWSQRCVDRPHGDASKAGLDSGPHTVNAALERQPTGGPGQARTAGRLRHVAGRSRSDAPCTRWACCRAVIGRG
jgi:hypothetical protein